MNTALYLDTARMGAICPTAREACQAYLALTASEGCSTCFESLFRDGFDAWPMPLRARYAGLATWPGLTRFKDHVRAVTISDMPEVLIANRTSHLTRLAARCLFRVCQRVLTTDLEWRNFMSLGHPGMRYIGVELDRISGRIARALHPDQDIRIENFRDTRLPDDSVDGVIGNVPFADVKLDYHGQKLSMHDFFLAKSIDALKPGGVLALVTTHFTLDNRILKNWA